MQYFVDSTEASYGLAISAIPVHLFFQTGCNLLKMLFASPVICDSGTYRMTLADNPQKGLSVLGHAEEWVWLDDTLVRAMDLQ